MSIMQETDYDVQNDTNNKLHENLSQPPVETLRQLAIIADHEEDIRLARSRNSFKGRTLDWETFDGNSRGAVHLFRLNNIITRSDCQMGSSTRWEVTDDAKFLFDRLDEWRLYGEFSYEDWKLLSNNPDLLLKELPESGEFQAGDVELIGRILYTLHEHGFIERVHQRANEPDTWRTTSKTIRLRRFFD